jgi:hypothetical protein
VNRAAGEGHVQALVRPGGVVVLAPGVHRSLGVLHAGERPADVEQFQLQGLVQPLDLPGRGRAGLGQPLGDPVLPADPLEQHFGRAGLPEPAGELLAVPVRTSEGIPYSAIAAVNARQTARAVARMTTAAMTQNREWSSIPVMTLHSRPPARNRLAVTSICHSSIAAERSQRRQESRRRRRETGSIR